MTARVTEIAPDIFRITTHIPGLDLQFHQFLVRDDEPLLYHTGMNALFPAVHAAVATLIDPATLRWIGFSHFEADESGSMNRWLEAAPQATVACGMVAAAINVEDAAVRPPRVLQDGEVFATGRRSFRYLHTPQLPHGWDAGMLFEETTRTLFCSDILTHTGDVAPFAGEGELLERFRGSLLEYNKGPFANYMPHTAHTESMLERLVQLAPRIVLPMHGAGYEGDGARLLRGAAGVMREVLG